MQAVLKNHPWHLAGDFLQATFYLGLDDCALNRVHTSGQCSHFFALKKPRSSARKFLYMNRIRNTSCSPVRGTAITAFLTSLVNEPVLVQIGHLRFFKENG